MDLELAGKRVLVTGSSRGIGLAIARGFLLEGASVVLNSRNSSDLDELTNRLSEEFGAERVAGAVCDFSSAAKANELRDFVEKRWSGLDVLVANVGSGKSVSDPIPDDEHFQSMFQLNFSTAINAARAFLPLLGGSRGNIVFIGSIAGVEAIGAPIDYSTAKTALASFSSNLAKKYPETRVRVNCVNPGNVFFKGGTWDEKQSKDPDWVRSYIEREVPMQRFATSGDIASAALFLSSRCSAFVNGACLLVDGGQTNSLF